MIAEENNVNKAGCIASHGEIIFFGEDLRYAVYAVHTNYHEVAWLVVDKKCQDIILDASNFLDVIDDDEGFGKAWEQFPIVKVQLDENMKSRPMGEVDFSLANTRL